MDEIQEWGKLKGNNINGRRYQNRKMRKEKQEGEEADEMIIMEKAYDMEKIKKENKDLGIRGGIKKIKRKWRLR